MRLSNVLACFAALTTGVRAQGGLESLAENMPSCALMCFMQAIPTSTCATDLTSECLCSNTALNAAVGACAKKTCTVYELLQTKNVSAKGCGVPERYKGQRFLIGGIIGCALAVAAFILRMAASIGKQGRKVSWDDATMAVVLALAIPPTVFAHYLIENGLGRDIWTLNAQQITNVLFYYYVGEIFYVVALGISKISILFFYLRVFPDKKFKMLVYSVMGASALYTVAFFIVTTFQCRPLSFAWNQWDGLHQGSCNDIHLQGWIAAAINIVLDATVMALPMKHLAGLNMGLKKKLMVMAMFGVGIFVVVVSVVRLYSLIHFANTQNITWNYVDAGLWSLIEIDVSIICGCMPAHRFLIGKLWPKMRTTFQSSKATSTKRSDFSANTNLSATPSKLARVSIKGMTAKDDSFIPLSDIDSDSDRAHLTKEAQAHAGSEANTWPTPPTGAHTNQGSTSTTTVGGGHSGDRPQDWNWPTTGKEHV
ncbi:hypothetical protein ACJQWK_00584 [Exserohilum turcicum]|uniref:CFEM domain-containing protein n=1 Tax=Exserohilum turcicum (strain 28A) TaxID=671987 RepID=R0K097_EXST2|nr:uncharacterized protein SETTUDRAFT_139432 [Exserohilum turcica Et28A]EOA83099.1 hypothetical protein SETTUDRAFT_139432 [Exserohilum turcica Et28A]